MNKSIIITGEQGSGKTTKAIEISSQYGKNEVVFISRTNKCLNNPFIFSECTKDTKIIVFDDVKHEDDFNELLLLTASLITVNKRMEYPFTISPRFIFVCGPSITKKYLSKIGPSFNRKFNIINCQRNDNQ